MWISRYTTRRSFVSPLGDCSFAKVRLGNLLTSRTASPICSSCLCGAPLVRRTILLIFLLQYKSCLWVLEQPSGSIMFLHGRFQQLLRHTTVWGYVGAKHARACMHMYAAGLPDPHVHGNLQRIDGEAD